MKKLKIILPTFEEVDSKFISGEKLNPIENMIYFYCSFSAFDEREEWLTDFKNSLEYYCKLSSGRANE